MRRLILFPVLNNKKIIYLDNAGSSLKFKNSVNSITNCYKNTPLNLHSFSSNIIHEKIKEIVDNTRRKFSELLKCNKNDVFFIPSFSYALNFLALSFSKRSNFTKEEILLTKLEHSSNLYPWIKAVSNEKNIKYVELNFDFSINKDNLRKSLCKKTKIFSFCHISNNVGVKNDIKNLVNIVRSIVPNCIVIIDGSQSISSEEINVEEWDIDVFLFSCHKFYSSTGIGIMYMNEKARKFFPEIFWGGGSDLSNNKMKFEIGSLPTAEIFGIYEAVSIIKKLNLEKLRKKRKNLLLYTLNKLKKIESLKLYNEGVSESIILFNIEGFHSHDISDFLAKRNIYVRSGNFCTPFISELIKVKSAIRLSLALYNKKSEIDLLLNYLRNLNIFQMI